MPCAHLPGRDYDARHSALSDAAPRGELTGALELLVPFMVAISVANWVGNLLTCGMDEMHIRLRCYPHLDSTSALAASGPLNQLLQLGETAPMRPFGPA